MLLSRKKCNGKLSVKTLVFVNNYLPHINRQTFVNVSSNVINHLNLTQNRIQTISNDSFLDFTSFYVLDLSSNIDMHLDTCKHTYEMLQLKKIQMVKLSFYGSR
jgi:hypothetical protein